MIAILTAKISLDNSLKNKYSPDMTIRLSLFHDLGKIAHTATHPE